MNEHNRPELSQKSGPSMVWLIPLVTMIIGGWLITRSLIDQVPMATLSFKTAEGIEAGKTPIKYKSVDIGLVEEIQFGENFEHVILTVSFHQGMEEFLQRDTRFWVVRPQLSLRGVSGLGTLISGSYIEIDPGPGVSQSHFVGLEQMPLVTRDDAGTQITLVTDNLGSVAAGSPIYYQGLLAGEVLGHELGSDAKSIYIHAFIRDPFDQLVKGNSRFWNVSGMDLSLDANGFKVKTASMQALMFGGIAFETPATTAQSVPDVSDLIYTLHESHEVIEAQIYTRKQRFVMYFTSSVRGLNTGAPLEFKGIRIGEVVDVRLEFSSENTSFKIPVLVEIEPERIINTDLSSSETPLSTLMTLIDRGLRARLSTGSLLTGQLFVELNMYPGADGNYMADINSPYPEIPTIPGTFEALTQSLQSFVAKLETVEIDNMGDAIIGILQGADELLNKPESEATVTDLQASMRALKKVLQALDEAGLDETIGAANGVLSNVGKTLQMLDDVLDPDSPLQYNLIEVTQELDETAKSVKSLVELLERHPQALIFGRQLSEPSSLIPLDTEIEKPAARRQAEGDDNER